MSEFNPFSAPLFAKTTEHQKTNAEKSEWLSQLAWYNDFNLDKCSVVLTAAKTAAKKAELGKDGVTTQLQMQKIKVAKLKEEASLGLDPRYWLSSQRTVAKRGLEEASIALTQIQRRYTELQNEEEAELVLVKRHQADLDRYRSFDSLKAQSAISCLDLVEAKLDAEISSLKEKSLDADLQLQAPFEELEEKKRKRNELSWQINEAEQLDNKLTNEKNSYERAMIHRECDERFGEGKPGKIIGRLNSKFNAIERDIKKQEERLKVISKRLTRDIRTIVIDGNNLCYQQSSFIGTTALQKLASELINKYKVIIVFDASMRGLLKSKNSEIMARFDTMVKVHVMATKEKADETILGVAENDSTAYIISNDRFAEFMDKPAVAEHRLLRHEILNNMVYMNDLNLSVQFTLS